jgi:hypothetical protein
VVPRGKSSVILKKELIVGWVWWLISIIPATQKTLGGLQFEANLSKKVTETPSQSMNWAGEVHTCDLSYNGGHR